MNLSGLSTVALKVSRHLSGEREVASIEPLYLLNARSSVFGKIEDIDLPMTKNNSHTDRRMTKRVSHSKAHLRRSNPSQPM